MTTRVRTQLPVDKHAGREENYSPTDSKPAPDTAVVFTLHSMEWNDELAGGDEAVGAFIV